jgi:glycosyltransferase involved in cell wall biosynthesis
MSLDWLLGPQLAAFSAAGYDVVGMSAPGPHVDQLEGWGVRHVPVPSLTRANDLRNDLRACREIVSLLRDLRPDVLHTHNPKPGVIGRVVGRLTGVPLVVNTQHGLYAQPTDAWTRRLPVYAIERLAAAFGHVELVQNPEDLETLRRALRVPERKLRLLGNGIDLDRFDPARVTDSERAAVRRSWDVADDVVVVGTVGRLVREKGITELLDAAAQLATARAPAGVPVRLVVVGPLDGAKADAVDSAMVDRAAAAGVVFAGERTDMPQCYAAMDLFVTASWREGFPRSAMEASAMGLAVVGTDIRGTRQVVDDGVTGILVRVRSADDLARAIGELAADGHRRRSMGVAGRRRAEAEFDQRRVIDRTLAVYTSGVGRSAGSSCMVEPPS